jgi:hypothetical protein
MGGQRLNDAEEPVRLQDDRQGDERSGGADPTQARLLHDEPHGPRLSLRLLRRDACHREGHPEGEPGDLAGQA